jgi:hypothetical protein
MRLTHLAVAALLALLAAPASLAQSPSDLLQKGLHLQEAAGDVDGAIAFFRQVVSSASATNKPLAAQAQYQLVLCMLQKGDRAAADRELAALTSNFGSMTDLIDKARKLLPGSATLLPAPWGDSESEQLNIKRDGALTSECLFYSANAWTAVDTAQNRKQIDGYMEQRPPSSAQSDPRQNVYLRWELRTANSTRGIWEIADRDTLKLAKPPYPNSTENPPHYESDDDLGDPLAVPFTGPATDIEESVFVLRRLPLAVGYKTSIPVTSRTLSSVNTELTVTAIETIQTIAGKFNCYKVSFPSLSQTFWIGVEGTRPLVKIQMPKVEAELVKTWDNTNLLKPFAQALTGSSISLGEPVFHLDSSMSATVHTPGESPTTITIRKRYTAPADIPEALQRELDSALKPRQLNPLQNYKLRSGSLQRRTIGGQQALVCILDYYQVEHPNDTIPSNADVIYKAWIVTSSEIIEISADSNPGKLATLRWRFEPLLDAVRIP